MRPSSAVSGPEDRLTGHLPRVPVGPLRKGATWPVARRRPRGCRVPVAEGLDGSQAPSPPVGTGKCQRNTATADDVGRPGLAHVVGFGAAPERAGRRSRPACPELAQVVAACSMRRSCPVARTCSLPAPTAPSRSTPATRSGPGRGVCPHPIPRPVSAAARRRSSRRSCAANPWTSRVPLPRRDAAGDSHPAPRPPGASIFLASAVREADRVSRMAYRVT
jgi:hypothetical protein